MTRRINEYKVVETVKKSFASVFAYDERLVVGGSKPNEDSRTVSVNIKIPVLAMSFTQLDNFLDTVTGKLNPKSIFLNIFLKKKILSLLIEF